jgi:hypothetical protein
LLLCTGSSKILTVSLKNCSGYAKGSRVWSTYVEHASKEVTL